MKNISDIAKLAGVSKSTVSRFLNNGSVSPATKEKITKIIEENNYQPNQFCTKLKSSTYQFDWSNYSTYEFIRC